MTRKGSQVRVLYGPPALTWEVAPGTPRELGFYRRGEPSREPTLVGRRGALDQSPLRPNVKGAASAILISSDVWLQGTTPWPLVSFASSHTTKRNPGGNTVRSWGQWNGFPWLHFLTITRWSQVGPDD